MPVPVSQMATVASYVLGQKLRGRKRYPLVLMLEPLYRCNLSCAGCGKIQYPKRVLKDQLSFEECMRAVDECGTPMVSIPGGEPLLHPEIDRIVEGLVERRKYIYLCTNALLLEEKLDLFEPSKYLSFSVHLDGLEEEHDASVCREGTYTKAVSAIRAALDRGFRVTTNTTLFSSMAPERATAFFDEAMKMGVEGLMVSPGYSYEKAPDQDHFMTREATASFFRRVLGGGRAKRWQFNQSPLFLEFLAGGRDLDCTPWGMPTYSVFGWQKPCYLLQEGYAETFQELLDTTEWDAYGHASGRSECRNCMVHSGFEASAVEEGFSSWSGFVAMARAWLRGPAVPAPGAEPVASETRPAAPGPKRGDRAAASAASLADAFRYRGDVTLHLVEGGEIAGYVTDLREKEVRVWETDGDRDRRVPVEAIGEVSFSGRDPAASHPVIGREPAASQVSEASSSR